MKKRIKKQVRRKVHGPSNHSNHPVISHGEVRIKRLTLEDAKSGKIHRVRGPIQRVRLHPDCCICGVRIGGKKVYIGDGKWRCYDCEPGSPSWLSSEVGKDSSLRPYFLTKSERKKEGCRLSIDIKKKGSIEHPLPGLTIRHRIGRVRYKKPVPKKILIKKTERVRAPIERVRLPEKKKFSKKIIIKRRT